MTVLPLGMQFSKNVFNFLLHIKLINFTKCDLLSRNAEEGEGRVIFKRVNFSLNGRIAKN